MVNKDNLNRSNYIRTLLKVATGQEPPDLIIEGGNLVNVHTAEIFKADIAIKGMRIVAVGDLGRIQRNNGSEIINAEGKYLTPGFIEPHLHLYHAHQNFTQVSKLLLSHGTTTVADSLYGPGQVSIDAFKFFIKEIERTPLKLMWLIPIVTYLQNRQNGLERIFDTLNNKEVFDMLDWPECYGLEEPEATLMVEERPDDMLRLFEGALKRNLVIPGHAWGLNVQDLNAYIAIGASSDHEGESKEDAINRARLGMWVQIRHGGGAIATPDMVRAITENKLDSRYFCFCSDLTDQLFLKNKGNIDEAVRVAIMSGVNPITAIQMGTLNAADSIGISSEVGSIAPGKFADIIFIDDLPTFKISTVIANGKVVVKDGEFILDLKQPKYPDFLYNTIRLKRQIVPSDFEIKAPKGKDKVIVRVIEVKDGTLHMPEGRAILFVENGKIQNDIKNDVLKIALVETFKRSGNIGKGFTRGFNLKKGAIASTHNPWFHGIAIVGTNDSDMMIAANKIAEIGGGEVAVVDGKIMALYELPISGVCSEKSIQESIQESQKLSNIVKEMGCNLNSVFKTLGFTTACGNIGDLKIFDSGIIDIKNRKVVDIIVNDD